MFCSMLTRLSDDARREAFARAERFDAAQTALARLTEDECRLLYVELETRLARGMEATPSVAAGRTERMPQRAPLVNAAPIAMPTSASDLPFLKAKRIAMETFDREYLTRVMAVANDSVTDAARRAGVDRTNFRRMLQRSGLRPRDAKEKPRPATYTDRILRILEKNSRGLRTCEIAEQTGQPNSNAFATLRYLERRDRVIRHGTRYNALWTLPGVEPVPRVESIPAALVAVLAQSTSPMDAKRLHEEIRSALDRNVGKKPVGDSLKRAIGRLIANGVIARRGANEHGPMYVLVAAQQGAASVN